MRALQAAFDDAFGKVPALAIEQLLEKKLCQQGLTLSRRELQRLRDHISTGASSSITLKRWRWWEKRDMTVEFQPEEVEEFARALTQTFAENLPNLVVELTDDLSTSLLADLRRRWRAEYDEQGRHLAGFRRRLQGLWDTPLSLLAMLLTIAKEFGESTSKDLRESTGDSPYLVEVLTRLHARACQVTSEIWTLLASGFADGAMARWRTLHEIAVVAMFVQESGEGIAARYVEHQAVESWRAAVEYLRFQDSLGMEPLGQQELVQLATAFDSAVDRFGASFATPYGWAAEKLASKKPSFADIERAVGVPYLRTYYRMASHNVHANPKGVFFRLGLLDNSDVLLAGPSDLGLADPGYGASLSLVQTTAALTLLKPTLDSLVGVRMMLQLQDEVAHAFMSVHNSIEGEFELKTKIPPPQLQFS